MAKETCGSRILSAIDTLILPFLADKIINGEILFAINFSTCFHKMSVSHSIVIDLNYLPMNTNDLTYRQWLGVRSEVNHQLRGPRQISKAVKEA